MAAHINRRFLLKGLFIISMGAWNRGTMEPCNHGTVEPWNRETMEPWNNGTVEAATRIGLLKPRKVNRTAEVKMVPGPQPCKNGEQSL